MTHLPSSFALLCQLGRRGYRFHSSLQVGFIVDYDRAVVRFSKHVVFKLCVSFASS